MTGLFSSFKRDEKRLQGRCLQTFWKRPDSKFLGFVGLMVLATATLSLLCKSGHGQISREIDGELPWLEDFLSVWWSLLCLVTTNVLFLGRVFFFF